MDMLHIMVRHIQEIMVLMDGLSTMGKTIQYK